MFRQHGAIVKEFINNKASSVQHVRQVQVALTFIMIITSLKMLKFWIIMLTSTVHISAITTPGSSEHFLL